MDGSCIYKGIVSLLNRLCDMAQSFSFVSRYSLIYFFKERFIYLGEVRRGEEGEEET